jgi:hypothetical protein
LRSDKRQTSWAAGVDERDALFAVSEFGVGLAGFSAVFVALVRRSDAWEAASAYRLELLVIQSLAAGLFALLPVTVRFLGVEGPAAWRLSSALLILLYLLGSLVGWRRSVKLPEEARKAIEGGLQLYGYAQSAILVLLLLLNVVGFPFEPQIGPYFLGLVVLLLNSAVNFAQIVLTRPSK